MKTGLKQILAAAGCVCLLLTVSGAALPSDKASLTRQDGPRFHDATKLKLSDLLTSLLRFKSAPPPKKVSKQARVISLPAPDHRGIPFETALQERRSARSYADAPLTLFELSQLLFAAQGITGHEQGFALRSAPSAGALYPLEVYAVALNVSGLPPGIYHYVPDGHTLKTVKTGSFKKQLISAALDQEMTGEAAVSLILSAVFERSTYKYGQRGYRYAYMEAGHVSQNIYLQAASLGLASVCVGAFYDDELNRLLGIDEQNEAALYIHSVGRP